MFTFTDQTDVLNRLISIESAILHPLCPIDAIPDYYFLVHNGSILRIENDATYNEIIYLYRKFASIPSTQDQVFEYSQLLDLIKRHHEKNSDQWLQINEADESGILELYTRDAVIGAIEYWNQLTRFAIQQMQ